MAHPLQDPEYYVRMMDLFEHRLDEAKHMVALMWGTSMETESKNYLDSLTRLYEAAVAFRHAPNDNGVASRSGAATNRSSEGGSTVPVDGDAQVDTVTGDLQR